MCKSAPRNIPPLREIKKKCKCCSKILKKFTEYLTTTKNFSVTIGGNFQSFPIFIIGKRIIFILIVSEEDIEELQINEIEQRRRNQFKLSTIKSFTSLRKHF
jgi:hypothetical protein